MKQIQIAVVLQADWGDGRPPRSSALQAAAKKAIKQALASIVPPPSLVGRVRFDVRKVSTEWTERWRCLRGDCNYSEIAETTYDDLVNSGIPICPECGDDMERVE